MKIGQIVNGYRIVTQPTNDQAGKCIWAFATRNEHEYFIKEFIELKRPRAESMGSPEAKRIQLEACERFERRHNEVMNRLNPNDLNAGNLVLAVDFFYEGTRYYKVTERLHHNPNFRTSELTPIEKVVLVGTLADSLAFLHGAGIVHGDLKPQNVLLHQPLGSDLFTSKLIDFDDAYVSGDPPDRDLIPGDALYGSPEFLRYMQGDTPTTSDQLTTASDIFAFGLFLHYVAVGELPGYDSRFGSPAECINGGGALLFARGLNRRLRRVVEATSAYDSRRRPGIPELLPALESESLFDTDRSREDRLRFNRLGRTRALGDEENFGSSRTVKEPAKPADPCGSEGRARPSRVRFNFGPDHRG